METITDNIKRHDEEIKLLNQRQELMAREQAMEKKRIDDLEKTISGVNQKLDNTESRINSVNSKVDKGFERTIGQNDKLLATVTHMAKDTSETKNRIEETKHLSKKEIYAYIFGSGGVLYLIVQIIQNLIN